MWEADCDNDCSIDCEAHDDKRATPLALTAEMTLLRKGGIANVMVLDGVRICELNSLR